MHFFLKEILYLEIVLKIVLIISSQNKIISRNNKFKLQYFQCAVVSERQKLMADQIKIRRRQRKDTLLTFAKNSITSTMFPSNQISLNALNSLLCKSSFDLNKE